MSHPEDFDSHYNISQLKNRMTIDELLPNFKLGSIDIRVQMNLKIKYRSIINRFWQSNE